MAMDLLQEALINCPYCGEPISLLLDASIEQQEYIEDCQVCCKPMVVHMSVSPSGECRVDVHHQDDA
jgi:hypothetical protein